jgi:hypothetical protein
VKRRQSNKDAAEQQDAAATQQAAYDQGQADAQANQAPPAAQAPAVDDTTAELQKLSDMKSQGLITDDEFTAAKAKLLGI